MHFVFIKDLNKLPTILLPSQNYTNVEMGKILKYKHSNLIKFLQYVKPITHGNHLKEPQTWQIWICVVHFNIYILSIDPG